MEIGVVVGFQNPPQWRSAWEAVYRETFEYVELAESLGIDEVWLTEHHFVEDGYCPSLLPVASALAARTQRIRIGTKLILLPFHDPLRLAEDVAVVDIISGGRFDLGVGAGYRAVEFDGFGVDPQERGGRLEEGVTVLRLALSGEPFTHQGAHYSYGPVQIVPPPVQRPVPIWMGGRSPGAMRRAARSGCHLQLADFVLDNVTSDYKHFAGAVAAQGRSMDQVRVATVATVFLDPDPERAWRIASPHLLYQQNQYARWFSEAGDRPTDVGRQYRSIEDLRIGTHLVGSPETVVERIRAVHAAVPFTDFSFWMLLPGLPVADAKRSLELFAAKVLPALRQMSPRSSGNEVSA